MSAVASSTVFSRVARGTPAPRVALPEAPRRIRLGMPHLDAGGLSENWLFRDAGDRHWEAIGRRLGVATDQIRSEAGERLYPTVVAVRARYDAPLSVVRENDVFAATAEVVPCGRACAHGRVVATIGASRSTPDAGAARFSLELLTTFAARAPGGLRMALPEASLARRWVPANPDPEALKPPAIATLARAARHGEPLTDSFAGPVLALPDRPLAELRYEPSPYADYNAAGLLYFASYVTIADTAERQLVQRLGLEEGGGPVPPPQGPRAADWALATSAVRRDVFYYDNLPIGAALTAALMSFACDGREVTTRIRLSREAQRPMADVITRRRFVGGRAGARR